MSAGPRLHVMTARASAFPSEAVRAAEGTPGSPGPCLSPQPCQGRLQAAGNRRRSPRCLRRPWHPGFQGRVLLGLRHPADAETARVSRRGIGRAGEPDTVLLV